jgi:hypothetical protein
MSILIKGVKSSDPVAMATAILLVRPKYLALSCNAIKVNRRNRQLDGSPTAVISDFWTGSKMKLSCKCRSGPFLYALYECSVVNCIISTIESSRHHPRWCLWNARGYGSRCAFQYQGHSQGQVRLAPSR